MVKGLRERAQEAMRAELASAALDLMVEHGYEGLSVEEIARELGISRATFHRHLGSKDDVVIAATLGAADQFSQSVRALSDRHFPTTWALLRAAMEPAAATAEAAPERVRARLRLIQGTPTLGARLRRARLPQIEALTLAIEGLGFRHFDAAVLSSTSISALDHCWGVWVQQEALTFRVILDQAFVVLASASTPGALD